ncbi:MAG: IS1182 family transposase [Minisyncoccia bacterium]
MLKNELKQLSLYSILYNKIPENHILKRINSVVDFSFINSMLEDSYCKYYGRPAKEPEMMAKILILQYLYSLSDVQVIDETSVNLAFMWFIGINPEDDLPDPSLLAKFRTQRLKETTLDDIIKEIVKQCVEKGIIKGTGISIDCTHSSANTNKLVPERIMKHLSKKILKNLEKEKGEILEEINTDIPNYKEIEDHKEAKETMKAYLEELINEVETAIKTDNAPKTQEAIEEAKEILKEKKFIEQKGIRSLIDKDARVGYKTKTDSFFGYKIEFAMLTEERIITAINVYDGAYVDGTEFKKLYRRTKECGIQIKNVYGDKAYFRQSIIDLLENEKINIYIPVSQSAYKMDESKYTYNKDSDQWFCIEGNYTVKKEHVKRKKGGKDYWVYKYYFEKEKCRNCTFSKECSKGSRIEKVLEIGVNTPKFYEYSQREKTKEFIEEYKKRARHEGKNGELKRFHGLDRARGYGLKSMLTQAKLTVLAVNLKRIAHMVSSFFKINFYFKTQNLNIKEYHLNFQIKFI